MKKLAEGWIKSIDRNLSVGCPEVTVGIVIKLPKRKLDSLYFKELQECFESQTPVLIQSK